MNLGAIEKIFLQRYLEGWELKAVFEEIYANEDLNILNDGQKCKDKEELFFCLQVLYKKFLKRLSILQKLELFNV